MAAKQPTKRAERPPKPPISRGTPWEAVGAADMPVHISPKKDTKEADNDKA